MHSRVLLPSVLPCTNSFIFLWRQVLALSTVDIQGSDTPVLRRAALATVRCWQHPWPPISEAPPSGITTTNSSEIIKCPLRGGQGSLQLRTTGVCLRDTKNRKKTVGEGGIRTSECSQPGKAGSEHRGEGGVRGDGIRRVGLGS